MGRASPDPFHDFADDAEIPLSSCRAKLFAIHQMLSPITAPGEEVLDAVRTLVNEALTATDQMIEMHGAAFNASPEAAR